MIFTHTHGVLQASNLPKAKRLVVDDHHATQSLMLGDFSLALLSLHVVNEYDEN